MKKTIFFLLSTALALSSAWAYDFSAVAPTGQTLYYDITSTNNHTVSVTFGDYTTYLGYWYNHAKPTGSITIPSTVTYNGTIYSVTSLGRSAFYMCRDITNIVIPNSVTSISDSAFFECFNLTNVNIPNSVTSIGNQAFYSCSGIIGNLNIPNSVITIGASAFHSCNRLTGLNIGNSVTTIGDYAFASCSRLTSVTLPNSVTSIGSRAFSSCIGLASVTVPNSVTSIGFDAFRLVKNIIYHGSASGSPWGALMLNGYEEGDLIYSDNTKTHIISCRASATSVTIPNSVTSIGDYAFAQCSNLTSIDIPNSVRQIGDYAFESCSSLTGNITLPNHITNIGEYQFGYCENLTGVTIPNSVTRISFSAFTGCTLLSNVNIPSSVTYIGHNAFLGCSSITNIDIPNSVTYIGSNAFRGCSFTTITIPNSITTIADALFYGCSYLTNINIPNSITSIGNSAFSGCSSLTSVTIPNSVTYIGDHAFSGCNSLTGNLTIPDSVTYIGEHAFYDCSSLIGNLIIPNSVTTIGTCAFYGCNNLSDSLVIPISITSIGDEAFHDCGNLRHVVFNARNCDDIIRNHYYTNPKPFSGCTNLSTITIGDSVQRIPPYLFYNTPITSLSISNSVTYIGDEAFSLCTNLTGSLNIPNSVTYIGERAFLCCRGLTNATILCSAATIGDYAFSACDNLTSVTISNSISSIGIGAFNLCRALTEIISNANNAPTLGTKAFYEIPNNIPVYIPCGSLTSYQSRWSQFTNFVERPRFTFHFLSVDETMGNVDVVQQPTCGEPAIVEAMPADGYIFSHWSDGTTQNPYTLTVTSDTVLTAFFTTTCSPLQPSDLPYFEDFDNYTASTTAKTGVEPSCWTLAHPDVNMTDAFKPMIYYSTAYAHSGRYSLGLLKRGIYAMPEFDGDVSTLQLSMYVRQTQPTYQLIVGVMEDLDDEASFVPVATIDNATTTSELVTVNFRAYTGNGKFIAFRNTNVDASNVYSYNYIDDITLELAPAVPDEPDEPENPCLIRIADLPYSEDFDNYTTSTTTKTGVEPPCWTLAHMDVSMTNSLKPMIYYGAENAHSGNYALNLYKRGIYAMPEFEGNVNTLQMSMYVKQTQLAYQLVVGVMSDLDDESSFVPVATIDNATRTAELVTVDFRSYTGNGKFIAFRNTNADPSNTFSITYIDDITLDANPEVQTYTITADANDDAMGYVLGFGQYAAGSQATLTAVPYDGYRFSHWNDGDVSNPRTFTVTATENLTAYFETAATETNANITMVTVEEEHNKIYWDAVIGAVSYNIYREGAQAGHFTLAGTANANATDWTDMSANANAHSYRYCISYIDAQGVESPLSAPHKTMHLTINKGLDDHTWNLIWSPYEGMEYVSYQIFRGISENNMTCIDVISSDGNITYTDENAPTGTVYYQVAIVWSTSMSKGCNDMPKSNIAKFVQPFECYTVETTGTTITVTGCENKPVRLYDMAGRLIDSNVNAADVQELQAYSTGIYLVQVDNDPAQKVVVIGR